MSLYKRGGIWWMRFTPPGGRELRQSTGTADKRQAQELHDIKKAELWRTAKLGARPRHSWKEAVVRWVAEHPERKSMASVKTHLRQADPLFGALMLDQIGRETLAAFVRQRRAAGVKNSSINQSLSAIGAILRAAHDWGWMDLPPRLKALPTPERRLRWLTREEADRLLAELPPHLAAMARFSLATGLREANVCGLEWRQVDWNQRRIRLHPDQMKAGRALTVPLNADAMVVLREQQGRHPERVFTYAGKPIHHANSSAWQAALKRAGLDGFRWHDLRHTWASWHVQAGTPLPVLKELGGWATLDMVLRYAHLSVDHLAEHAERISGPRLVRTNSGTTTSQDSGNRMKERSF